MNKALSLLAVILLFVSLSCNSAGSGSIDSENLSEAAGALAAAGAVMGAGYDPPLGSPPVLTSPPLRATSILTYYDGVGGTAEYDTSSYTIDFDNFHVPYNDNQYILNGQIGCNFNSEDLPDIIATFEGDVTIEGGNLSGAYNVNIEVLLNLEISDSIVVTGSVSGTVNENITINETILL